MLALPHLLFGFALAFAMYAGVCRLLHRRTPRRLGQLHFWLTAAGAAGVPVLAGGAARGSTPPLALPAAAIALTRVSQAVLLANLAWALVRPPPANETPTETA